MKIQLKEGSPYHKILQSDAVQKIIISFEKSASLSLKDYQEQTVKDAFSCIETVETGILYFTSL